MMPESVITKHALATRLTTLRAELFGDRGAPEMARQLGIPVRTWYNYEAGVTVPAEVALKIIALTSVEPNWLLSGERPQFRSNLLDRSASTANPKEYVKSLLRAALGILDSGIRTTPSDVAVSSANDGEPHAPATERFAHLRSDVELNGSHDGDSPRTWIRHMGDAMAPVLTDGAVVAFAKSDEPPQNLDGRLVVAWLADGEPVVRWFQHCGRYGVLRAESLKAKPSQYLIDLEYAVDQPKLRRVLWAKTAH
jgi:hypothetical protein